MNEYTPIIRVQKNSHLETENIRIVFNERQLGHESYIAYMSLRIHLTLAAGLPKYQLEAPSDQGCFLFLFFIGPCPHHGRKSEVLCCVLLREIVIGSTVQIAACSLMFQVASCVSRHSAPLLSRINKVQGKHSILGLSP